MTNYGGFILNVNEINPRNKSSEVGRVTMQGPPLIFRARRDRLDSPARPRTPIIWNPVRLARAGRGKAGRAEREGCHLNAWEL